LTVWICSYCRDAHLDVTQVTACLAKAKIKVCDQARHDPTPGIILLDKVTPELYQAIGALSRHDATRLLLIAADRMSVTDGEAWHLLQEGATDLVVWSEELDPATAIGARLQRWREVDDLVASEMTPKLVGQSRAWTTALRQLIEAACYTDAPILLVGETGTGKELMARLAHSLDAQRSARELVIVDCTTIVPELSGSELFGHERGAFTGAVNARDGAFALADGGTLFLDEVGELAPALQVQLLRVLQEHSFKRVGSNAWRRSNFRLICATNRDLPLAMEQDRFRRDLYYRLATWTIHLPPLRERKEDISLLVEHFLQQARPDRAPPPLSDPVRDYFLSRDYPGNVRDLKNLVFRLAWRHTGPGPITIGDIPADEWPANCHGPRHWCDDQVEQIVRQALAMDVKLRDIRHAVEDTAIRLAIENASGNLQRASARLGVTDRMLQKWRAEQQRHLQELEPGRLDCSIGGAKSQLSA
jgi:transcriptional regulator with GAF, ATPase, and Fis domain